MRGMLKVYVASSKRRVGMWGWASTQKASELVAHFVAQQAALRPADGVAITIRVSHG